MKLCSSCHEALPPEAFHRNRKKWDGLACYCKACAAVRKAAAKAAKVAETRPLYTNEELAVRASLGLWEHVLEMFTCRQLAQIWGCGHDQAWRAKTKPNETYMQGTAYFSEDMKRRLRDYLEV